MSPDDRARLRAVLNRGYGLRGGECRALLDALDAAERERDEARAIAEALLADLDRERGRLAACGVVAMADTLESAARVRDMVPEYHSASCDDVARRVDECIALRDRIAALESAAKRLRAEERKAATAEERRAVVADLRWQAEDAELCEASEHHIGHLRQLAERYERGEHREGGE